MEGATQAKSFRINSGLGLTPASHAGGPQCESGRAHHLLSISYTGIGPWASEYVSAQCQQLNALQLTAADIECPRTTAYLRRDPIHLRSSRPRSIEFRLVLIRTTSRTSSSPSSTRPRPDDVPPPRRIRGLTRTLLAGWQGAGRGVDRPALALGFTHESAGAGEPEA